MALFLPCSCTVGSGDDPIDAGVSGASAINKSQNCTQGHAQDRIDCRNNTGAVVDALSTSLKKHTEPKKSSNRTMNSNKL